MVWRTGVAGVMSLAVCVGVAMGDGEPGASGVEVRLVSDGEGARRVLRYSPRIGALTTVGVSVWERTSVTAGGLAMPEMVEPTRVTAVTVRADDVAGGSIEALVRVDEASIEETEGATPRLVDLRERTQVMMTGLVSVPRFSTRGIGPGIDFSGTAIRAPEGRSARSSLERDLSLLVVAFPEEAIGVGGVWEVRRGIEYSDVEVRERRRLTLEGLDGDVLTIGVEIEWSTPDAEPGEARVTGTGRGRLDVVLSSPLAVGGELESEMRVVLSVTQGDRTIETVQTTTAGMRLSAR